MKPEHRFHSYTTAATVAVMYFVILHLLPLLGASSNPILRLVGTLLLAVGVYKTLSVVLQSSSRTLKFVKRHLLGASYVNGTWIGKFEHPDGSVIYTVEHFEQTLSSLKIRGRGFRVDGTSYAQWTSVSETIDEIAGILTYTYGCDKADDKTSFQGVCVFQFERVDEASGPTCIRGYSADLVDGIRTANVETKLSESLISFNEALSSARKLR